MFVADGRTAADCQPAGIWYLAGSNRCVYSYPPGELDAATPALQESDRRWRDDELLLPRRLTEGRSQVRLRIQFLPGAHPLLPGTPAPANAWSEYRYTVYSYVL